MIGKGADLSGLDSFNLSDLMNGPSVEPGAGNNNLLIREVPINKIHPDPNNSRQRIDPAKITELADSMKAVSKVTGKRRGIKNPLSLKPHPELDGEFIINAGFRRYLAAQEAGFNTVPAFIDSDADEYDNAVDNIQREGLTTLEMAHFIQRQIDNGDKKLDIAEKLGKPPSFVSDHISFFELPDCIRELYDAGRCVSIQALAILHRTFKNYPDEVETYCIESMIAEDGDELTTSDVRRFCNDLKKIRTESDSNDQNGAGWPGADGDNGPDSSDQNGAGWPGADGDNGPDSSDQNGAGWPGTDGDNTPNNNGLDASIGAGANELLNSSEQQGKLKKPIIQVSYDERPARLLSSRRAAYGFGWLKYDDDGEEIEVDLNQVQLVAVIEG